MYLLGLIVMVSHKNVCTVHLESVYRELVVLNLYEDLSPQQQTALDYKRRALRQIDNTYNTTQATKPESTRHQLYTLDHVAGPGLIYLGTS